LDILRDVMHEGQVAGPLVMDAVIAALAVEHGATLFTTDRDFSRFPRLKWTNPLASDR
jgi:predicted nucleic acid-binding protein